MNKCFRASRLLIDRNCSFIHLLYRKYVTKFPIGRISDEAILKEKNLPEFTYAGRNLKPHTRVYGMGCIAHGGLGVKFFFKPKNNSKSKPHVTYMHRPYRIYFADKNNITDLACGYGFTVFLVKPTKDSPYSCYGTGLATNCQIGFHSPNHISPLEIVIEPVPIKIPLEPGTNITKVSCGRAHTVVSTNTGEVWTFGSNSYGQCGRPVIENEDYSREYFHKIDIFKGKNINLIECGQDTSFVVSDDGRVYSCGWSADGQTGQDTYKNVDSFQQIKGDIQGENIVKVSCKGDCILAMNDKGDVFGWGNSEYKQLNSVTGEEQISIPKYLPLGLPKIVDIAAGGTTCFALTEDGEVFSWGYGTLGRGPNETSDSNPLPIPRPLFGRNVLSPKSKVVKIFAGMSGAAAVNTEGGLYSWGRNTNGMTGLGDTLPYYFPLRVCMTSFVKKASIGIDHMMVISKSAI